MAREGEDGKRDAWRPGASSPRPPGVQQMLEGALRLHQAGSLIEAEALYRQILVVDPRHADALHLLGVVAHQGGRHAAAVDLMRQAIAIQPRFAAFHCNLGNALSELGRHAEAIEAFQAAVRLQPDNAEAYTNLSHVLNRMGWFDKALAAADRAGRFGVGLPESHYNRGIALTGLGQPGQAAEAYAAALNLRPDYAEAHSNLGVALFDLGRIDEALEAYDAALRLKPDLADAHRNKAYSLLLRGDWAAGLAEYEWRWRAEAEHGPPREFAAPQWAGEDIAGRTLLLHAEQGLGDTLQFCRYARLAAGRGARVVLEVPRPLVRLLTGLEGVEQLAAEGDPLPAYDVHCPLMSLPGVFQTAPETIPASVPYLGAEEGRRAFWRERLGDGGFKVGVVWQGNPAASPDRRRSAPLAAFAPLAALPGVRLISLQKGHGLDQLDRLPAGMAVETLGEDLDAGPDAFVDTAAIMMELDLVVTVCTSTAHLAGALGRPVWIALHTVPHWVWTLTGETTPWYPSARLFRQTERGDWDGVFRRMGGALGEQLDCGPRGAPPDRPGAPEAPLPIGELIDKITILQIKAARFADPEQLRNVGRELGLLTRVRDRHLAPTAELADLTAALKAVNETLWQVEDDIRDCERAGDFGPRFIALARSVYTTNDRRAAIKRQINALFGSALVEEKSYARYAGVDGGPSVD